MIEIEDQEAEEKPVEATDARQRNVEYKKNVQLKTKPLKVGEIAHYRKKEDDEKIWEEACMVVEYTIQDPAGFQINDDRYKGTVIVCQCLADQFAFMDAKRAQYEQGVFRGRKTEKVTGAF